MSFLGKAVERMMTENISRHKRKRLIIFNNCHHFALYGYHNGCVIQRKYFCRCR